MGAFSGVENAKMRGSSPEMPKTGSPLAKGGLGRYETVSEVKRLQIYNGYMQRPFPNGNKCPFGCNGYVTAMAVGQRQRLYSGVRIAHL